jgi:hypothetical protein
MTKEAAVKFIEKYPNAKSFVKPSHLEDLSQLLEVHIEAIAVRKDEFHEMDGGKAYMPRKETLDKFAAAAGVSYNEAAESTRLEGDGCYVGRSQAMVMGPDGKMILGSACEYEFDVKVRTEEMKLAGRADWGNKDENGRPGRKDYSDLDLQKELINFRKVGRQRANTGARNRATVSILGMPTGIKGLFGKSDPDTKTVVFLFSRIIINAKNELVMNRMLDGIAGNAAALYGPQAAKALPPGQVNDDIGPVTFRTADDQQTTQAEEGESDFDFSDDPEISGASANPAVATDKELVDTMVTTLESWLLSDEITDKAKVGIKDALDRNVRDRILLEDLLKRTKANAKALKDAKEKGSVARKAS